MQVTWDPVKIQILIQRVRSGAWDLDFWQVPRVVHRPHLENKAWMIREGEQRIGGQDVVQFQAPRRFVKYLLYAMPIKTAGTFL